jgi:hypothetical protein
MPCTAPNNKGTVESARFSRRRSQDLADYCQSDGEAVNSRGADDAKPQGLQVAVRVSSWMKTRSEITTPSSQ